MLVLARQMKISISRCGGYWGMGSLLWGRSLQDEMKYHKDCDIWNGVKQLQTEALKHVNAKVYKLL